MSEKVSRRQAISRGAAIAIGAGIAVVAAAVPTALYLTSPPSRVTEINVLMDSTLFGPAFGKAVASFNEDFKGEIHVTLDTGVPYSAYKERLFTTLIEKPVKYDAVIVSDAWFSWLLDEFEDLIPYAAKFGPDMAATFPAGLLKGVTFDGRTPFMPVRAGVVLGVYRADLFHAAGVDIPETLDQLVDTAMKLNGMDDPVTGRKVSGCALMLSGDGAEEEFMRWFVPLGGSLFIDPNDPRKGMTAFDSEHGRLAVQIIETWKKLYAEGLLPDGALGWAFTEVREGLMSGLAAMGTLFCPAHALATIDNPGKSPTYGKWMYSPLFKTKGLSYGGSPSLAIPKNAPNEKKEAAYQFIRSLATEKAQLDAALCCANGPTIFSVYENPEFRKAFPGWDAARTALEQGVISEGRGTAEQPQIVTIITEEIAEVLSGRKPPSEAVQSIWSRIQQIYK